MKIAFVIYHDILEDRISLVQDRLGIDFYTKWDNVTGKGHSTDAHLGTRTFPGFNSVKMVAFTDDDQLEEFLEQINKLNGEIMRTDDKVRVFQLPLERIL
ncbi:MAG: hypothetical protein Q8903_11755 [Bacteroidota bacterium]|nr:hypothetical protein [Bacteroidota bacterium]